MINTRKQLHFYIMADYMMNRGYFKPSIKQKMIDLIYPDYIMRVLVTMRKIQYYSSANFIWGGVLLLFNKMKYRRLSIKLGFSIGPQVFGYGLVIPHYGTIVVGQNNRCGNYCVLHTSTCISGTGKQIGNALYFSTGAKMTTNVVLGDNISVSANSLVNKSFREGNALLVGSPAYVKESRNAWYIVEGGQNARRVESIEKLKRSMNL